MLFYLVVLRIAYIHNEKNYLLYNNSIDII